MIADLDAQVARDNLFRCERYDARLSPRTCAQRWRQANGKSTTDKRALGTWTPPSYTGCVGCAVGEQHARGTSPASRRRVFLRVLIGPAETGVRTTPPPRAEANAEAFRLRTSARPAELARIVGIVDGAVDAYLSRRPRRAECVRERHGARARLQARAAILRRVGARALPEIVRALDVPISIELVSVWIARGRRIVVEALRGRDDLGELAVHVDALMRARRRSKPPKNERTVE